MIQSRYDLINIVLKQELTDGRGVDIAVDALGGPKTFQQCIQSVRGGGKAVMIGLSPSGGLGEVDIIQLVRRKVSFNLLLITCDVRDSYSFLETTLVSCSNLTRLL